MDDEFDDAFEASCSLNPQFVACHLAPASDAKFGHVAKSAQLRWHLDTISNERDAPNAAAWTAFGSRDSVNRQWPVLDTLYRTTLSVNGDNRKVPYVVSGVVPCYLPADADTRTFSHFDVLTKTADAASNGAVDMAWWLVKMKGSKDSSSRSGSSSSGSSRSGRSSSRSGRSSSGSSSGSGSSRSGRSRSRVWNAALAAANAASVAATAASDVANAKAAAAIAAAAAADAKTLADASAAMNEATTTGSDATVALDDTAAAAAAALDTTAADLGTDTTNPEFVSAVNDTAENTTTAADEAGVTAKEFADAATTVAAGAATLVAKVVESVANTVLGGTLDTFISAGWAFTNFFGATPADESIADSTAVATRAASGASDASVAAADAVVTAAVVKLAADNATDAAVVAANATNATDACDAAGDAGTSAVTALTAVTGGSDGNGSKTAVSVIGVTSKVPPEHLYDTLMKVAGGSPPLNVCIALANYSAHPTVAASTITTQLALDSAEDVWDHGEIATEEIAAERVLAAAGSRNGFFLISKRPPDFEVWLTVSYSGSVYDFPITSDPGTKSLLVPKDPEYPLEQVNSYDIATTLHDLVAALSEPDRGDYDAGDWDSNAFQLKHAVPSPNPTIDETAVKILQEPAREVVSTELTADEGGIATSSWNSLVTALKFAGKVIQDEYMTESTWPETFKVKVEGFIKKKKKDPDPVDTPSTVTVSDLRESKDKLNGVYTPKPWYGMIVYGNGDNILVGEEQGTTAFIADGKNRTVKAVLLLSNASNASNASTALCIARDQSDSHQTASIEIVARTGDRVPDDIAVGDEYAEMWNTKNLHEIIADSLAKIRENRTGPNYVKMCIDMRVKTLEVFLDPAYQGPRLRTMTRVIDARVLMEALYGAEFSTNIASQAKIYKTTPSLSFYDTVSALNPDSTLYNRFTLGNGIGSFHRYEKTGGVWFTRNDITESEQVTKVFTNYKACLEKTNVNEIPGSGIVWGNAPNRKEVDGSHPTFVQNPVPNPKPGSKTKGSDASYFKWDTLSGTCHRVLALTVGKQKPPEASAADAEWYFKFDYSNFGAGREYTYDDIFAAIGVATGASPFKLWLARRLLPDEIVPDAFKCTKDYFLPFCLAVEIWKWVLLQPTLPTFADVHFFLEFSFDQSIVQFYKNHRVEFKFSPLPSFVAVALYARCDTEECEAFYNGYAGGTAPSGTTTTDTTGTPDTLTASTDTASTDIKGLKPGDFVLLKTDENDFKMSIHAFKIRPKGTLGKVMVDPSPGQSGEEKMRLKYLDDTERKVRISNLTKVRATLFDVAISLRPGKDTEDTETTLPEVWRATFENAFAVTYPESQYTKATLGYAGDGTKWPIAKFAELSLDLQEDTMIALYSVFRTKTEGWFELNDKTTAIYHPALYDKHTNKLDPLPTERGVELVLNALANMWIKRRSRNPPADLSTGFPPKDFRDCKPFLKFVFSHVLLFWHNSYTNAGEDLSKTFPIGNFYEGETAPDFTAMFLYARACFKAYDFKKHTFNKNKMMP